MPSDANPEEIAKSLSIAAEKVAARDYDAAIRAADRVLRLEPDNWNAHFFLGLALAGKDDVEGSISAFREAVRLNPTDAHSHTQLGLSLGRRHFSKQSDAGSGEDLQGAFKEFRAAVRLDPNLADAHAGMGSALMMIDDVDGAIAAYREAVRLNPRLVPAHAYLALLLEMKGDSKGAANHRRIADDLKQSRAWEDGPALPAQETYSRAKGIAKPAVRAKKLDALFNVATLLIIIVGIVNIVRAPSDWIRQCLAVVVGYFGLGNISLLLKYTGVYPAGLHGYPVGGRLFIFDCLRSILWQATAYACLLSFSLRGGIKFGGISYLGAGLLWALLGFTLREYLWGQIHLAAYPGRRLITELLWRCIALALLVIYF